tara:strand:+ start:920 stop:1234 length:315 start_codon:yes stop_codon:yes gene_type:complete
MSTSKGNFSAAEQRRLRKLLKQKKKSIDPKLIAKAIKAGVQPSQYVSLQGFKKGGSTSKKVSKVMKEFKEKKLNIGKSKKKVKSRKQAIAIALNEAGKSRKRKT